MSYTPENNPYIPGDPYSYDLKWIVEKLKECNSVISSLDDKIKALIIKFLDEHDPVYFNTAGDLIASDVNVGALVYIMGYHNVGDGGANYYIITDDYNDVLSSFFYLTLDVPNKWAIPVFTTEYAYPEMFGAYGDNTNDDTVAIQMTLDNFKVIRFKPNQYLIESPVTVPGNRILEGSGRYQTRIHAVGNALELADRYIKISDMTIKGSDTGYGIVYPDNNNAHFIIIKNCDINNFNNGIRYINITWNCTIQDVRINNCTIGINCAFAGGCMLNTYINLYINSCERLMRLSGFRQAKFIGCNFGFTNETNPNILIDNVCDVSFDSCNFECDEQCSQAGLIDIGSRSTSFYNCIFKPNLTSNGGVFIVSNPDRLIINNCVISAHADNQAVLTRKFFNNSYFSCATYGGVSIEDSQINVSLGQYTASKITGFKIRNRIPFSGTNIDPASSSVFEDYLHIDNYHPCYYNGTNIIDATDGSVVV